MSASTRSIRSTVCRHVHLGSLAIATATTLLAACADDATAPTARALRPERVADGVELVLVGHPDRHRGVAEAVRVVDGRAVPVARDVEGVLGAGAGLALDDARPGAAGRLDDGGVAGALRGRAERARGGGGGVVGAAAERGHRRGDREGREMNVPTHGAADGAGGRGHVEPPEIVGCRRSQTLACGLTGCGVA